MDIIWESELAELLERLAATQQQLLGLLSQKHDLLMKRDHSGLAALVPQEENLCAELQACHDLRQQLLDRAAEKGLPADSIQSLTQALPAEEAQSLKKTTTKDDPAIPIAQAPKHRGSGWLSSAQCSIFLTC